MARQLNLVSNGSVNGKMKCLLEITCRHIFNSSRNNYNSPHLVNSIRAMSERLRRPKVLVTNPKIAEIGIETLRRKCDVFVCENESSSSLPTRQHILSHLEGVDGILWATKDQLNAEVLDRAGSQLKVISTPVTGFDCIDVAEVQRRGISLGYVAARSSGVVADVAIGLMIAAGRRFHEGFLKITSDQWDTWNFRWLLGRNIEGSTVGIVGFGGIGQAIAKRLNGFDIANLLYTGHKEKAEGQQFGATFVSFDELLRESDFIFASCPLTNETENMFDKIAFGKMKRTAVFINVARGGMVVQDDLVEALKNGTIFAAGIDTVVPEPLPADHALTKLSNCVVIPHLGSAETKIRDEMAIIAAQNILNGIEGKPLIYSAY